MAERLRFRSYLAIALVVAILALGSHLLTAEAALLCNPSFPFAGRYVQSCKDNYNFDTSYWKGRMVTKVLSGGAIAKLGWNYWSDTRWCNGVAVFQWTWGSSYGLNATNWASTSPSHPKGTCAGANEAQVYGIHYWEQSGSSTTEPWSYWRTL